MKQPVELPALCAFPPCYNYGEFNVTFSSGKKVLLCKRHATEASELRSDVKVDRLPAVRLW